MTRTALSKKSRLETALGPVMSQEEVRERFFNALLFNDLGTVKKFIDQGVDLYFWDQGEVTALFIAVAYGHLGLVRYFINEVGVDINIRGERARTLLHRAAWWGQTEIVKFLLEKEINIFAADKFQQTALHVAEDQRYLKIINLLKQHALNLIESQQDLNQRLLTACKQQDLYQVKEVLQKGADVHFTDQYGNAVLFYVVGYEYCLAIVDCLLEQGAAVNLVDDEDKTPLWIAIEHHCFSIARLLLSYGANANAQNQDGETVLFCTASRSDARMTELLLSYGANPNLKSKDGLTPLHETTDGLQKEQDLKNARLFLEAGANVNAVDDGGATPLDYAQESEFLELQALLLEYGGKPGECLSLEEIKATNAIAYQVALMASKPEENNHPFFQPLQNSNTQENPL